jgi:caa(3)-type oxidase subunit IV
MSEDAHAAAHNVNYVKIWAILVVLLMISVLGPLLEIPIVTLITAFGIACVKAFLVAKNFMHLNLEKRFVVYMLVTALAFMGLFFFATAPDIMNDEGRNWTKPSYAASKHSKGVSHGDSHSDSESDSHSADSHSADAHH